MKILLVKQEGMNLGPYIEILRKREIEYEELDQLIEGHILTSDSVRAAYCETFYKAHREVVDAVQFFLPLKDWTESRNLLGRMWNRVYSGYLASVTRHRRGFEKTAEHELLHKVDNWIRIYLGIRIEDIFDVNDFDDDVVHGDDPRYTEYDYDQVWEKVRPYLNAAIEKRKNQALLGYYEQLLIWIRKTLLELQEQVMEIEGLQHPLDHADVTYEYGVSDNRYPLTRHHIGTDYRAPLNTPIFAPQDGEVVVAGYSSSLGYFTHYAYIHEGSRHVARFLHLRERPVPGKYKKKDIFAHSGDTGMVTGPHCHIDIWLDEVRLDLIRDHNFRNMTVDPEVHFA